MSNPKSRKSCVVPKCVNTTTNAPQKLFFYVPMDAKIRKKWLEVMRRADPLGPKSAVYCCEDHFDVENDMENYVRFKLVGGIVKLKKGVVPHKFECQKKTDQPKRCVVRKRNQIKFLKKLLYEDATPSTTDAPVEFEFVDCCEDENVVEHPLALENNKLHLEISKPHKAVQVRMKNKVICKATMTEKKYFERTEDYIK